MQHTRTNSQGKGQQLVSKHCEVQRIKYLTSTRRSFETCLSEATEACFGLAQIAAWKNEKTDSSERLKDLQYTPKMS
jgi:hypothetical protein